MASKRSIPVARPSGAFLAATAAAALMASGATAATTVYGNGAVLPTGTAVGGSLSGPANFTMTGTGGGLATCMAGNFEGVIGTNPGLATPPNTPVGVTLTALTFSNCTDAIPGYNVTSVALLNPGTTASSVLGHAVGGTLNVVNPTLRATIAAGGLPGICNFTINRTDVTMSASALNNPPGTPSTLGFAAVPITTASGVCASSAPGTFNAVFAPFTVRTAGPLLGQKVTVTGP